MFWKIVASGCSIFKKLKINEYKLNFATFLFTLNDIVILFNEVPQFCRLGYRYLYSDVEQAQNMTLENTNRNPGQNIKREIDRKEPRQNIRFEISEKELDKNIRFEISEKEPRQNIRFEISEKEPDKI